MPDRSTIVVMDIDLPLFLVGLLPFAWAVIFQERLYEKAVFEKATRWTFLLFGIGLLHEVYFSPAESSLFFIGIQVSLLFVLLYRALGNWYFKKCNRPLEFSKTVQDRYALACNFLIGLCLFSLPFLLDEYLWRGVIQWTNQTFVH